MRTPTPVVFAASLLVAVVLLWRGGTLLDLGGLLERASWSQVVLGFGLYAAGLVVLCWRWHVLVRIGGGDRTFAPAAEAFLTSVVLNYAAPIGLAVPARAVLSARDLRLSVGAAGAVAFWEVGLDLALLGALTVAWVAIAGPTALVGAVDLPRWVAIAAVLVLLVSVGLALMVVRRRPAIGRRLRGAVAGAIRYPGRDPAGFGGAVGLTVGFWAIQAVILRLLVGALGMSAGASASLLLGLLGPPIFVGMISPVPGGAGVREALMLAVAGVEGADGAAVLLAAVAYRTALFVAIPVVFVAVRAVGHLGKGGAAGGRGAGG